jgi:hypothetical protein
MTTIVATTASISFCPPACPNSSNIGTCCTVSSAACEQLQPCRNDGTCSSSNTTLLGYRCEFDYRPCQSNTCWNNGKCHHRTSSEESPASSSIGICTPSEHSFDCWCTPWWQGMRCQTRVNLCRNVTCQNSGVCRTMSNDYLCECLGTSFSGRHCEITSKDTLIRQAVAKTLAFIAIIALLMVALFVLTMDVLTYVFGIDVAPAEANERRRRMTYARRALPVMMRPIYVDHSEAAN